MFEKFAGIFGPALFAASVTLFQSSRAAVLSVILFFVAGAIVLSFVDVEAGEAAARRDPASEFTLHSAGKEHLMAADATAKNQKTILANQAKILGNQKKIVANQAKILANQKAILKRLG